LKKIPDKEIPDLTLPRVQKQHYLRRFGSAQNTLNFPEEKGGDEDEVYQVATQLRHLGVLVSERVPSFLVVFIFHFSFRLLPTFLPFVGFFIRLTKSVVLNDALTLFYAVVYWAPFSFVMNVYARLFLSHKVATFRNARPSFVKKNAYNYSSDTDIFYSKDYSDLDDSLEEWGTVEYLPFVYNAVLNKYNTRLNFKQDLHGPLLDLVTHSTDDEFRVLDIGPGTRNSTMDISSALRNA